MTALLLLLLVAPPDAERLFALGNALYVEGDMRGAIAAYEGASETGWTSAALERNLGLAYAKTGALGRAVLHTERAHRLGDAEAARNLRLLRARLGLEPEPLPPTEAAARWLAEGPGVSPLAGLALVLYLAALALVGNAVWHRALPRRHRRALVALVPLALALAVAALSASSYETAPRAVVVTETATLRSAPTAEAGQRAEIPEGVRLAITDRRGPWLELRLGDGTTGWASGDAVEVL